MQFLQFLMFYLLCGVFCRTSDGRGNVDWKNEAKRSALKLSESLDDISENLLGYHNFQEYYNTLSFRRRRLSGEKILQKIVQNFGQKIHERNFALTRLKEAVERSLSRKSVLSECCKIDAKELETNDKFKQPTGKNACHRISKLATKTSGFLSKTFEDACAKNLREMPFLRWQYFTSETGITSLYPAMKVADCDSFDGRFRPFYVQGSVPEPKDIVIVIDKSGSMKNSFKGRMLMNIANEAAKTVVSTLNPHDRVAVIGFSGEIITMGGKGRKDECFGEQLAQATSENVESLNQFITKIKPSGSTHYGLALSKAFDYFDKTVAAGKREQVILFLSDGAPTDAANVLDSGKYIFNILQSRNGQLNNSVILMTYGLGGNKFSILRDMALQSGSAYGIFSPTPESIRPGLFTHVSDPSNLRLAMGSYYSFFSGRSVQQSSLEPIWSLPYLDMWGIGLLMSATLPVYERGLLAGVVGTDLTLDDFLSAAVYFRPSEFSYIFVIDSDGFVIYHPLFKYPENHDVKYVDIMAIESDANMIGVIEDMKNGRAGSATFSSERVGAAGSSKRYGIQTYSVITKVHWKQIPHSKFSVCVVLTEDDEESILDRIDPHSGSKFLYHRLDLVAPEIPCAHYNNYCAMNQSTVSLSPRAFVEMDAYLSSKETTDDVVAIKKYMESGRGGNSIKEGIRNSVWATQEADRFWKNYAKSELEKYVMWRYIGTKEGIMRIFPGSQLPKDFDPVARPWYRNAVANKERLAFSLPYRDAASGEHVMSISKVIYEGTRTGTHNSLEDEVVAVMGCDMLVPYFKSLLSQTYPMCVLEEVFRCSLIDTAGFVLYTNTLDVSASGINHITQIEPRIAESLISNGIMQHSNCLIMEETQVQRTYKIARSESHERTTDDDCLSYEFAPIPGTNSFMIVRQSRNLCPRTSCPCSRAASADRRCVSHAESCECPCVSQYEDYNACSNKYNFSGTVEFLKPCTLAPSPLKEVGENERGLDHLPKCTAYSETVDENEMSGSSSGADANSSNLEVIIPVAVAVVLVLIVLAGVGYWYYRKNSSVERRPGQDPLPTIPSAPKVWNVNESELDHENVYINATVA